jgi:hypothetical protein
VGLSRPVIGLLYITNAPNVSLYQFLPEIRVKFADEKSLRVAQWRTQEFCSTNPVKDRGQRERGSGAVSSLVRVTTQFANE